MAMRDGQPIDLIWVLVDWTHPGTADLLAAAEVAHRERVPEARLSVNRFVKNRALVKIAIAEGAFRARLPPQAKEAIIRTYTEADHKDALALVRISDDAAPALTIKAVLDFGGNTDDGRLVQAVAVPWFEIVRMIEQDPASIYHIDWRKMEEIIAGAYVRAGYDEVILTPRSGDGGKDIIAVKKGVGCVRIFDQVKAYKPPRLVSADEVCAVLGVIGRENVSKGIITTTSEFAPRVLERPAIGPYVPYRLELKSRAVLLDWLMKLVGDPE